MNIADLTLMHNKVLDEIKLREAHQTPPPRDLLSTKISKISQIVHNSNHFYHIVPSSIIICELMNIADLTLMHNQVLDEIKQGEAHQTCLC